jgi:hypothetical protein
MRPSPATPLFGRVVEPPRELLEALGDAEGLAAARLRAVEGGLYALSDFGRLFSRKGLKEANRELRDTARKFPDFGAKVRTTLVVVAGQQARWIRLGDVSSVLEYLMLIPGQMPVSVRLRAAEAIAERLASPSILRELPLVSEARAREACEACGARGAREECEPRAREARTPPLAPSLEVVRGVYGPQGAKHLYACQGVAERRLWKIGQSESVADREEQLAKEHGVLLRARLVWPFCADLELPLHRRLAPQRHELGRSREFYLFEEPPEAVLAKLKGLVVELRELSAATASTEHLAKRARVDLERETTAQERERARQEEQRARQLELLLLLADRHPTVAEHASRSLRRA